MADIPQTPEADEMPSTYLCVHLSTGIVLHVRNGPGWRVDWPAIEEAARPFWLDLPLVPGNAFRVRSDQIIAKTLSTPNIRARTRELDERDNSDDADDDADKWQ